MTEPPPDPASDPLTWEDPPGTVVVVHRSAWGPLGGWLGAFCSGWEQVVAGSPQPGGYDMLMHFAAPDSLEVYRPTTEAWLVLRARVALAGLVLRPLTRGVVVVHAAAGDEVAGHDAAPAPTPPGPPPVSTGEG